VKIIIRGAAISSEVARELRVDAYAEVAIQEFEIIQK